MLSINRRIVEGMAWGNCVTKTFPSYWSWVTRWFLKKKLYGFASWDLNTVWVVTYLIILRGVKACLWIYKTILEPARGNLIGHASLGSWLGAFGRTGTFSFSKENQDLDVLGQTSLVVKKLSNGWCSQLNQWWHSGRRVDCHQHWWSGASSFRERSDQGSSAWCKWGWILSYNKYFGKCSAFDVELWGMLDGLKIIQRREHAKIVIQLDCPEAVKAIHGNISKTSNSTLIRRIQTILSQENNWVLRYVLERKIRALTL